jgi:hypothetical protein
LTIKFTQRGSQLLAASYSLLAKKSKFQSEKFHGPRWSIHRAKPATRTAHQWTVKALIKNYSALYLPNRFSCQISSRPRLGAAIANFRI